MMLLLATLMVAVAADPHLIPTAKIDTTTARNNQDFRLPTIVKPSRYEIDLNVPLDTLRGLETVFYGNVKIEFTATEPTDQILIHSLVDIVNMTLIASPLTTTLSPTTTTSPPTTTTSPPTTTTSPPTTTTSPPTTTTSPPTTTTSPPTTTTTTPSNTTSTPTASPVFLNINPFNLALNYTNNITTEITTILLSTNLTVTENYILEVNYNGILDPTSMAGFYRSEYVVNNITEYLGTTQFQPTNARLAFPCFDEPHLKAVFSLTITAPTGFAVEANTPELNNSTNNVTGYTTFIFRDTPLMSTYLLAFTVSKFSCTANPADGIPYRVCSRPDYADQRSLAVEFGNKLMGAMDIWTNYSFANMSIDKLDQFAIPDFSAGAMENWGLVTYRENLLLFSEAHTSNLNKQQILTIIAHEFAHMWFGNLVTTAWWDTLFLNEGFATYFEYFLLNQLEELNTFEIDKQFITVHHQNALIADAQLTSPPLISEAWTPAQIWNKFNTISYSKGGGILRMVENVITPERFQAGLQQYLVQHAFRTAVPSELSSYLSGTENVTTDVRFTDFIENWTTIAGFPLITASLSGNGNDIVLTQKRFLYSGDDVSPKWYVPIFYSLPNSTNNVKWYLPTDESVTIENVPTNISWIILNNNAKGFYRVHYDTTLRQRLISALLNNHTIFSDLNRAQIVDDALNLARAGVIAYSEAFRVISYLRNEDSYYPWLSAIRGLTFVSVNVGYDHEIGQRINSMTLELVRNVLADFSPTNWTGIDHVTSLKLSTVWGAACRAGEASCISDCRSMYGEFMRNPTNTSLSINPNIRSIVYCNALRRSTDYEDWNFLWNRLHNIGDAHERIYILNSLGCTTNRTTLDFLLGETTRANQTVIRRQDILTVWSAVITSSSEGLDVAFNHFKDNHQEILNHHSDAISVLPTMVSRFTTQRELNQLRDFIAIEGTHAAVKIVGQSALDSVNLQWQDNIRSDLSSYFRISSSATSLQISASLILALFVLIKSLIS